MTQGDLTEFAEFYSANFHRIAGQLYAYLGDHAEAQDISQEAFCRALERWSQVSAYTNALAWVRQVAWNLATSRLRHLQVAMRHLARQRVEHIEGPNPDRVALTRALATLPENHRLAVVLHHLGHLSVAEIAEQEGVAEGTVRSWLSRGRSQLAEYFVGKQEPDWNAMTASTFRPEGVEATALTVRRRRKVRRRALAVALVLALAAPVAIILGDRGTKPPIIGPTAPPLSPSPSPSPSPALATRTVAVAGVEIKNRPGIAFVDALHAWMLYDPCQQEPPESLDCRHVLGRTVDGGRTWQRVPLPQFDADAGVGLYALDPDTLTLTVHERAGRREEPRLRFLTTRDAGRTFTWYAEDEVPLEAQLARGEYQMLCPAAHGFEDGARGTSCVQEQLVRVGEGPVTPQPPIRDGSILNGADGRLWLIHREDRSITVLVSDDAKTWQETPPLPDDVDKPQLSPDGKELWCQLDKRRLVRLVDGAWRTQMRTEVDIEWWVPIGNGAVATTHGPSLELWTPQGMTPVREVAPRRVGVLADGTIVVWAEQTIFLGLGTGLHREWVAWRW